MQNFWRPPDWSKEVRLLRQRSCLICLGQSGGLMHSNDISLSDMDSVQYVQPLKMATIVETPPLDMMNTTLPPLKSHQ